MKKQIEKILNFTNFFKTKQCNVNNIVSSLTKPSKIVLQNIHKNWLQSIYAKTHHHYPVYLSDYIANSKGSNQNLSHGYIVQSLPNPVKDLNIVFHDEICTVKSNSELKFIAIMPQQDIMQVFIQWQRYRKYWWSSITTTPGLFSLVDVKYEDENKFANISANFNWGQFIVERLEVTPNNNTITKSCEVCSTLTLEKALLTILLDATMNTKEKYLRLHNKVAPYKISFALNCKEKSNLTTLKELAAQIFYKLQSSKISTWLPTFLLPFEKQIEENMQLGITYTAILSDSTLSNGIFHLMNSSTVLKEQVHLADFENYAALLCGKK